MYVNIETIISELDIFLISVLNITYFIKPKTFQQEKY